MGEVSTFAESKDLTLSNSSKASFSSLVISSSRDSIPPSPAATFTTPAKYVKHSLPRSVLTNGTAWTTETAPVQDLIRGYNLHNGCMFTF